MKKLIISATAFLLVAASAATAYAVSIDFPMYTAVKIGDLKVTQAETYTESRIEFSGPGLKPFMALLPRVTDSEDGRTIPGRRMLSIDNLGQPGVHGHSATSIYIECVNSSDGPACNITIIKGSIPG